MKQEENFLRISQADRFGLGWEAGGFALAFHFLFDVTVGSHAMGIFRGMKLAYAPSMDSMERLRSRRDKVTS